MKHTYQSSYGKVSLKPLLSEDIEAMRLLRNKYRDCFIYSEIITADAQIAWYQSYLSKDGDYAFSVFHNGKWIGSVSIYNVQGEEAEFGRLLIDSSSSNTKGLGVDTTLCVCNLAFEQMNISEIKLQVYENNIPAYKTYIRAGFTECGVSYDSDKNKLVDMILRKQ